MKKFLKYLLIGCAFALMIGVLISFPINNFIIYSEKNETNTIEEELTVKSVSILGDVIKITFEEKTTAGYTNKKAIKEVALFSLLKNGDKVSIHYNERAVLFTNQISIDCLKVGESEIISFESSYAFNKNELIKKNIIYSIIVVIFVLFFVFYVKKVLVK